MNRRTIARLAAGLAVWFALSSSASAYYYYTFFLNGTQNPSVPAHFNLPALVNSTVPFYISSQGPTALTAGDSLAAIVSEVRAAANYWNSVPTSALRLSYGGLFTPGRIDNAVSIDVEFSDDVPPGLLAAGAPASLAAAPVTGPNGTFLPITRSLLLLPNNMTNLPVFGATPSYNEEFFVTLVHEFGHTLGLQHTLTSSVMSTLTTSTSSKSAPLAADDIAGISLLYPAPNYLASVGSISGHVTLNGAPVGLASVVAISPSNAAISTLTNPDGSYQINGIPPGQYSVYAHPLPPADSAYGESTPDNLYFPRDQNENPIPPSYDPTSNTFAAQFYNGPAGTRNWQQAQPLQVTAANATAGINFAVSQRGSEAVSSVRMYGLTSSQPIIYSIPTPVMVDAPVPIPLVATGVGLLQNQNVTPGLTVSTLGSIAQLDSPVAFPPPQPYIAVYVAYTSFGVNGPGVGHLLFSTSNDLYVLPSAFHTVVTGPPSINSVTPTFDSNGNRAVTVSGSNLSANTRILFDGLQGTIENVNADGSLLVSPPPGMGSYTASVVALNNDAQSSLFLQLVPPTFTYDPAPQPSVTVSPSIMLPGSQMTISVQGVNTNFNAQSQVGFGTSDIVVNQVNVISPTALTITVTPNGTVTTNMITITTGLQIISQALGYQVTTTDQQLQLTSK